MTDTRRTRSSSSGNGTALRLSAVALALLASTVRGASPGQNAAARIMQETGVTGGLVVHVGCTDGRLAGALRFDERFIVHGLATTPESASRARKHLVAAGLHGEVAVHTWDGGGLPYVDGLVRLLVLDAVPADAKAEIRRVLCPAGVAVVRRAMADGLFAGLPGEAFRLGQDWVAYRKPWPETIDEWTHYLHDPTNNAVAADRDVGEPFHLQWVSDPKFARHHEHLSSVTGVVSAGGRLFSIVDEAPAASVMFPPEWFLVARDAFSGVLLWKHEVKSWHPHLWRFRTGPPQLARRLVAVGDRVYATLTYDGPVVCLDAATGRTLRTYAQTTGAEEILVHGDRVFAILGNPEDEATHTQRREARAAKAVEGLPDWAADVRGNAWDMDQEGDITGPAHLRDARFHGGVLTFRTDNDPFFLLNLDGAEAGAEYNLLVVRMNCTLDGNGQVY